MNYYLKIIKKNDAAWLMPTAQDSKTGNTVSLLNPPDQPGYWGIPSAAFGNPWYGQLQVPNINGVNLINLHMNRWRDANGNPVGAPDRDHPSGRNYFWQIEFQIVEISNKALLGTPNGETPVTDVIKESGLWYGDLFDLHLQIDDGGPCIDMVKLNRTRYAEWKKSTGRP